jgi:hypothetical protein
MLTAALGLVVLGLGGCGKVQDSPTVATAGGGMAGSASPTAAADPGAQKLRFNNCMAEHGVNLDDANAGRSVDAARMATATEACRAFLPTGGDIVRLSPQDIEKARQYAKCVRDHGIPDFPDPDPVTGQSTLTQEQGQRLKDDPRLTNATEACRNLLPGGAQPNIDLNGGGN